MGLFTVIFDKYKFLENSHIEPKKLEKDFFNDEIFVSSDKNKAMRVKKSILKNFGWDFLNKIVFVFSSFYKNKEDSIAKTLKGMYLYGKDYLYSSEKEPVNFLKIQKEVAREIHAYTGLLRFKEIEGSVLFAEFTPQNDILKFLTPHFKNRLKGEDFIIYDARRNCAAFYLKGELDYIFAKDFEINETNDEDKFRNLWREFYKSVSIDERKNTKLMTSNMPKKYWRYLPEKDKFKKNN